MELDALQEPRARFPPEMPGGIHTFALLITDVECSFRKVDKPNACRGPFLNINLFVDPLA